MGDRITRIAQALQRGHMQSEIAESEGVSQPYVARINAIMAATRGERDMPKHATHASQVTVASVLGVEPPEPPPKPEPEPDPRHRAARDLRAAGWTLERIAAMYGVAHSTIHEWTKDGAK